MTRIQFLTVLLISSLALDSYAMSCTSLLDKKSASDASKSLGPLRINNLVKNVDLRSSVDTSSLNPNTYLLAYTNKDRNKLLDKNFPAENFSDDKRIVETEFGYAVLDAEDLKAWSLLESIIDDPTKAQLFVNKVAHVKDFFPKGITKKAAQWIKRSMFISETSENIAHKKMEDKSERDGVEQSFIDFIQQTKNVNC